MIMIELTVLLPAAILASSDSGSDGSGFAYFFLLSGFVFYGIMYARYRNAGQRHFHEKETETVMQEPVVADQYVQSLKGLSNSTMRGSNHQQVKGSRNNATGQITDILGI